MKNKDFEEINDLLDNIVGGASTKGAFPFAFDSAAVEDSTICSEKCNDNCNGIGTVDGTKKGTKYPSPIVKNPVV